MRANAATTTSAATVPYQATINSAGDAPDFVSAARASRRAARRLAGAARRTAHATGRLGRSSRLPCARGACTGELGDRRQAARPARAIEERLAADLASGRAADLTGELQASDHDTRRSAAHA